jgi:hypothetical protein
MQGYMRKNKNIAKYVSLLFWTENGVVTESRLRNDVVCTNVYLVWKLEKAS